MPRTSLDWLGIVTLWLGAIIMAIRAGDLPAPPGAPAMLSSNLWAYAPLTLVTVAIAIFIYRTLRPASPRNAIPFVGNPTEAEAPLRIPYWTHDRIDVALITAVTVAVLVLFGSGFMNMLKSADEQAFRMRAAEGSTSSASPPP